MARFSGKNMVVSFAGQLLEPITEIEVTPEESMAAKYYRDDLERFSMTEFRRLYEAQWVGQYESETMTKSDVTWSKFFEYIEHGNVGCHVLPDGRHINVTILYQDPLTELTQSDRAVIRDYAEKGFDGEIQFNSGFIVAFISDKELDKEEVSHNTTGYGDGTGTETYWAEEWTIEDYEKLLARMKDVPEYIKRGIQTSEHDNHWLDFVGLDYGTNEADKSGVLIRSLDNARWKLEQVSTTPPVELTLEEYEKARQYLEKSMRNSIDELLYKSYKNKENDMKKMTVYKFYGLNRRTRVLIEKDAFGTDGDTVKEKTILANASEITKMLGSNPDELEFHTVPVFSFEPIED